jgi:hypothetical protein
MSASTPAPTIAIPEHRGRPGLALLLGLLGIPGVTLAWDLPLGGYWIGLPLAVAAIVLGAGARGTSPRRAWAAIALGAIEVLFTASWLVVALLG